MDPVWWDRGQAMAASEGMTMSRWIERLIRLEAKRVEREATAELFGRSASGVEIARP